MRRSNCAPTSFSVNFCDKFFVFLAISFNLWLLTGPVKFWLTLCNYCDTSWRHQRTNRFGLVILLFCCFAGNSSTSASVTFSRCDTGNIADYQCSDNGAVLHWGGDNIDRLINAAQADCGACIPLSGFRENVDRRLFRGDCTWKRLISDDNGRI